MFVVLDIKPYSKKAKRKGKKINHSPPLVCHTTKGLPFYLVNVCEEKRGINWSNVAKRSGRYTSRIVAPRNINIPDLCGLQRFIPSPFISRLVFNTSVQLLEKAKLSPSEFALTVTDRNAHIPSELGRLLKYSSQIRVITSHPEKYAAACAKAYDEYGASVIIRSFYEATEKPDIIVNCDSSGTPLMSKAALITSKHGSLGALRIECSGLELTPCHKNLLPEGVEATDFAGALSELCMCSDYLDSVFSSAESSCKKCKEGCANCLECYIHKAIKT